LSGGGKAIVIYLDVLFGINFLMDLIVIYIVNKICKFAATFLQILLSATLGAVWSVIVTLSPDSLNLLLLICTYVLISFLMVKICALKSRIKEVIKGVVVLYGVTFVLSGCIHMLYYYTYAGVFIRSVIMRDEDLLAFIVISLVLLRLIYIRYMRAKVYDSKKCRVCIVVGDKQIELRGFIDTGNVLKDPYSGKPVSVACKQYFSELLGEINDYETVKYHLVPFRSLGCESGLLEVITAEVMYIYRDKKEIKIAGALIGLTDMELSSDREYEMLINPEIIE